VNQRTITENAIPWSVMRTLILVLQLLVGVAMALARSVWRRLRCGPAVPSWSWSVEMRAVALRGFIMSAAAHPDPLARKTIESRFDPPLPRHLRRVLRRRTETVGGVPGEWIERQSPALSAAGTLLYFHGGAYLAGSPATHREWASRLTWATGCSTYVPDYRLAPQHRFPAAVDDAVAVYSTLLGQGHRPESVILGGDSAGGGLALALLLRLRDEGLPLPAGALLFSPYTDLAHTGGSMVINAPTDYLPLYDEVRPNVEYLGDHDPTDPYASPVYGAYGGIPPLLVFVGGREMILDDSTRLVDRVEATGGRATLHLSPDMYHVWPAVLPGHPETLVVEARCAQFVRDVVKR
jgi:acetyl esterase/lipase